jgi:hypothetical protein
VHSREDEALYILEGEITIQLGAQRTRACVGSFVWMPRGVPHTFANPGTAPVRLLGLAVPGGIEDLLAIVPGHGSPVDPAQISKHSSRSGRTASLRLSARSEGDPMSTRTTIAGPLALLAAPILVIVSALIYPTLSGDAARQVTALTSHRGAMITGMTLNMAAVVLLIAGLVWLAINLVPRTPRLAVVGGVAGVLGLLVVLFENSVTAAAPAIVAGLGRAQAISMLDRVHSGAISALEPLALVGDIGILLLGIAVAKAGAPRWAAAVIAVGALGEGAGFATGTKALVIISFVLLFAGLLQAVRTLTASSGSRMPAEPVRATAAI